MARKSDIDDFICPVCGHDECQLEQDYDDAGELLAEDIICDGCGYVECLY